MKKVKKKVEKIIKFPLTKGFKEGEMFILIAKKEKGKTWFSSLIKLPARKFEEKLVLDAFKEGFQIIQPFEEKETKIKQRKFKLWQKVWGTEVISEKEEKTAIDGFKFKFLSYIGKDKKTDIRVPLSNNGELMTKFSIFCQTFQNELSDRENRANLIQFSTFGERDRGLDFFEMIGFYKLGDFIVLPKESSDSDPEKRFIDFVRYYNAKLLNINLDKCPICKPKSIESQNETKIISTRKIPKMTQKKWKIKSWKEGLENIPKLSNQERKESQDECKQE